MNINGIEKKKKKKRKREKKKTTQLLRGRFPILTGTEHDVKQA